MVPAALVVQGAEIPPLVSRRRCWSCSSRWTPSWRRRRPARRRAIGQQTFVLDGVELPVRPNHRHLHPADLVHRAAGRGRAGAARRRCRSACRSSRRHGGRTSRCESRMRSRQSGVVAAPSRPNVGRMTHGDRSAGGRRRGESRVRPLREGAGRPTMSRCSTRCSATTRSTIRYGIAENLYGYDEIRRSAPRARRSA